MSDAPRKGRVRRYLIVGSLTIVGLACSITISAAALLDNSDADDVVVTGATVHPPISVLATATSNAIHVTWTPPGEGIAPQQYEVERRSVPGEYPAEPIGTVAASPYDDTGAVKCGTYAYRIRSRQTNLVSEPSLESVVMRDSTAPVIGTSAIIGSTSHVAGRVKPGESSYMYAKVDDDCTADPELVVTMTLAGGSAQTATAGSFKPIEGGPTYDFRAGPFNAPDAADGTSVTWSVSARDDDDQVANEAGAPATIDGSGPVIQGGVVVSSTTNYYAPEIGHGAVRPSAPDNGYFVYADVDDAGGVATVTANATQLTTDATQVALAPGEHGTDNGVAWSWRSESRLTEGASPGARSVTLTATDALGNQRALDVAVDVDSAAPIAEGCVGANGAEAKKNQLDNTDYSTFSFNEAMDPGSVAPSWTGLAPVTFTVQLRDGSPTDYLTYPGITMLEGNTMLNSFALPGTQWVGGNGSTFSTSSLERSSPSTFRITYLGFVGGGIVSQKGDVGNIHLNPGIQDVAANVLTASTGNCGTDF